MKLDTHALRYLNGADWKTLSAVETGSRNHEVVPTPLIASLSHIGSHGDVQRSISTLAKANLIAKVKGAKYDGYRLTYGGLDYLALNSLKKKTDAFSGVYSVGNQIGVGKESDIFVVSNEKGEQMVLKIHRLGRISFRTVKNKRDYLRKRGNRGASWMDMSRLAAVKEYKFMEKLGEVGVMVPRAIVQNRHMIVMELVDGFPLRQIESLPDAAGLYGELMEIVIKLAKLGLIHGDFNEFNILIKEVEASDEKATLVPVVIDFPQMVSVDHENADFYFKRDVHCVRRFFERKFDFVSDEPGPFFDDVMAQWKRDGGRRIDTELEASGFSKKMAKELDAYMKEHGVDGDTGGELADEDDDDEGQAANDEHDGSHDSSEEALEDDSEKTGKIRGGSEIGKAHTGDDQMLGHEILP